MKPDVFKAVNTTAVVGCDAMWPRAWLKSTTEKNCHPHNIWLV
jgi:hypothetical protein